MKLSSIFFLSILLLATILPQQANAQWYNRNYGVDSINELSHDQLNHAWNKADKNISIGVPLIIGGVAGLGVGSVMVGLGFIGALGSAMGGYFGGSEYDNTGLVNFMKGGIALFGLGLISIHVGIPMFAVGHAQRYDLKKAFGKRDSQVAISPNITWHQNQGYLGAKLSIPISR